MMVKMWFLSGMPLLRKILDLLLSLESKPPTSHKCKCKCRAFYGLS